MRRRHGPSLSCLGNGCFPPLLYGHLEAPLEPVLPAILIPKDQSAGGSVTGPGAIAAGKAG